MATETYNPNANYFQPGQGGNPTAPPAAQAPVTPAPQIQTPAAPSTTVNVNTSPQIPNADPTKQAPAVTMPNVTQAGGLTMPKNGSVVDLLNSAGQDSSYAARSQLAQQYGIQGYTGTAAQNTDLSKKYLEAYNKNKATKSPESGAQAASALDSYFQETPEKTAALDPVKQFMDSYAGMNPIEANIFQQLSTIASTPLNQQSLTDFYKQEIATQGLQELNMEFADIKRIMDGTEDDIRDEVTKAGGFATESQVQALAGARNKTLLKKANYLADVINAKNDYVDHIVSLTEADRKQVSDDFDRKLGITKTLFDMSEKMTSNAKENYQSIVDSVGWGGLASALKGNTAQTKKVEQLFGLAPGELQALGNYQKPLDPKDMTYQYVAGTENQNAGIFNPKTGTFSPLGGGTGSSDPVSAATDAIVSIESGGDYNAVSKAIPSGTYAGQKSYGKYQVLESNIPTWTKEATGTAMTPQQFLASPQAQDAVAKMKIGQLWDKYGNIADVASSWFTGGPASTSKGKVDKTTGMTAEQYIAKATAAFNQSTSGSTPNKKIATEVVDVGGKKVLINSQTGAVISNLSTNFAPDKSLQLAQGQQKITDVTGLLDDPGLNSAVGPNSLARGGIPLGFGTIPFGLDNFTGAKSNFIGGVEQLRGELTLDKLSAAKGSGVTFGALSDGERQLVAAAASKLGTWAIKDGAGNTVGYNIDEGQFKKELDKINNFAKLDFVLKGGDPSSVNVQEMPDGTLWTKNSEGNLTQLK